MKFKLWILFVVALVVFPLNLQAAKGPITFDPKKIDQTIGLGDQVTIPISFNSSKNLGLCELWIVPELRPYVELSQTQFTVEKDQNYTLDLTIEVPNGSQTGMYDGTIHIRSGNTTNPATFKLELNIVDAAAVIGVDGGIIEVTDPASPLKGTKLTFTDGATDGPTVVTIQQEDPKVTLPEEDYEIASPGIKITSSKPLKRFAKVTIPFNTDIAKPGFTLFGTANEQNSKKDLVIISRYDEATGKNTLLPVTQIYHYKKQLEFYTPAFSVFTGIKLFGLPPSYQINLDMLMTYVYPVLMGQVEESFYLIDGISEWSEEQEFYAENTFKMYTTVANGYHFFHNWETKPAEEIAAQSINLIIDATNVAYSELPEDEIDPILDLGSCVIQGIINVKLLGIVDPAAQLAAVKATCVAEMFEQSYIAAIKFYTAYNTLSNVRKIHETWIALDYLMAYYYFGGNVIDDGVVFQKMAENIGFSGEPTEENLINEAAQPYEGEWFWFGLDDYDPDKVKQLISQLKLDVSRYVGILDGDGDFIVDGLDNCPDTSNPQQYDLNQNDIGDDCELIQSVSLTGCPSGQISPTTMGWEFEVGPIPLKVTDLGFLNPRLLNPTPHYPAPDSHNVGIWSTDGTFLTSITVPEAAPLKGSFRFEPVAPTLLGAGMKYVIGADNDAVDPFCTSMGFSSYQYPFFKYLAVRMDKPDRSGLNFPAYSFTAEEPRYFGPNFLFERLPCAIVTHNYLNSMYAIGVITIGNDVKYVGLYDGPNINFIADNQAWLSQMPNNGDVYTFRLCYDELCSNYEEVQYAVNGVNYNLPSIISPSSGQTVQTENFTISWEPSNLTPIAYYIAVAESGNRIWGALVDRFTTSMVYNYDGSAIEPLQSGKTYSLYVYAYDEKWNLATTGSVFYSN